MRAIVIKQYGGPEVLAIEERPDPKPEVGRVVIEAKVFGFGQIQAAHRLVETNGAGGKLVVTL